MVTVLHQVDQLGFVSVADSEPTNSQIREETPILPLPRRLDLGSPAMSVETEGSSRKRKRPSKPTNPMAKPKLPSQPPTDDRGSERLSLVSKPSKKLRMDCVLITTLPPVLRRKPPPPQTSEDEDDRSRARAREEKRRGKQREVTSTLRASVRSDSQSLVDESMRSKSHSVSSLRRPLFEPVGPKLL